MRIALAIVLCLFGAAASPQAGLWSHVDAKAGPQHLPAAQLTEAQLSTVARLIRHQKPHSVWECEGAELDALIKGLTFEAIPVGPKENVVLASAPSGCGRGGQGANGAMWVIRLDGTAPALLATPDQFSGWLFSVQPTLSHGYPDIVLGWHMSAREATLNYFRFDGRQYLRANTASLLYDEDGNAKIVATPGG